MSQTPPTVTPPPAPSAPLTITCPANAAGVSTTGNAVQVTFPSPVTSGGVPPVQTSCTRTSGSAFTVGPTSVQCTATDAAQSTASCSFTVTVTAEIQRLSRTRFLAFGDSLTAGEVTVPITGLDESDRNSRLIVVPQASYPTQLDTMLRARYATQTASISVVNSGLPGEWAVDAVRRLPGVITSVRPDVLLLMHGENDLSAVGQTALTTAWQALDTMAKEGRNRGARVFIATLPPPRAGGLRAVPMALVTAFNDRLRTTARGEGAVLVDVYPAFLSDVTRLVGTDGAHLTEAGYRRLAELFFDAIRADLEVR